MCFYIRGRGKLIYREEKTTTGNSQIITINILLRQREIILKIDLGIAYKLLHDMIILIDNSLRTINIMLQLRGKCWVVAADTCHHLSGNPVS